MGGAMFTELFVKMKVFAALLVICMMSYASCEEVTGYEPSKKFLIGVVRTNIISAVSTSTVKAPYSCYKVLSTSTSCAGKRKKKRSIPTVMVEKDGEITLDSTNDESQISANFETSNDSMKAEKMVIWTTTTTTVIVTSTSILAGTTLSLSYACTTPSMDLPPG